MCVVVSALTYKPYGKLNHEMLLVLAGRLEALESRLGRVAAGRGEVDMIEDEHAVGRDSGKPDAASEGSSVAGCSEDSHPDADE